MPKLPRFPEPLRPAVARAVFETRWLAYAGALLRRPDPWLAGAYNKHKGERCFVLATGPSLRKVDLRRLRGEVLFGVNGAYMLDEVDLTYFVYLSNWWWEQHLDGIRNVRCERRFLPSDMPQLASDRDTSWFRCVRPRYASQGLPLPSPAAFSLHPGHLMYAGGTVLFACLQLAHYMGFEEVVLLGVDHSYRKSTDGAANQHGGTYIESAAGGDDAHFRKDYVKPGTRYHVDLNAMERGYEIAERVFRATGRRIVNASPGTCLTTYPVVDFDDVAPRRG